MLIQNNKTFEQYYEEFKPAINRMVYRFKGLKTSREDLQQEAAILLWKLTDKLNTMEKPISYFIAALRNIFTQILIDEHKQGLWATDSIYKQHNSEEYNLLDRGNYTTAFNYNFYDPWLENYYQRRREYRKEYYSRPEVKERMRVYQREYYNRPEVKEKRKQDLKEYLSRPDVKAKRNEYNRNYYYNNRERILEYQKIKNEKIKERYATDPEYREKHKEASREYYRNHKNDEEFKEKQRAAARERYNNNPESRAKKKASTKRYLSTEKGQEAKYRGKRKCQINQKLKKHYKEAATMTLEELKNNYEKIEDEILELMVDLDLLRAIEEPDNKIKRKIFSKEYELESLQYIKEDIKNEIEKRNTNN